MGVVLVLPPLGGSPSPDIGGDSLWLCRPGGWMHWENSPAGESSPVPATKLYWGSGKEIAEDVGGAVFSVSIEFCQIEEIWQCQAASVSSLTQTFLLSTHVSRE